MAVVRKRGRKFIFDYRLDGKRLRVTLDTKLEADELCGQYERLRKAEKLEEFNALLVAKQALLQLEVSLSGTTLRDAIHKYTETCSKLKCIQTQKNERADFKNLYDFLHKEKDVFFLREVTPQLLEEYQGRLFLNTSGSTCNRRFTTYKHFFNKCVQWDMLPRSPAVFLKRKQERANPRKTFTDAEILSIADQLPAHTVQPFLFFAVSGVRPGEGMSGRISDWDVANKTLLVESGKNARFRRLVHLSEPAREILAVVANGRDVREFLFVNTRGQQMRPAVLTGAVRRVCRRLGLEEGKTPYGLRHTFATKHAALDVSSEKTRQLMGHASIRTTEKYYKLGQAELKKTVEQVAKVFDFRTKKEVETVTDSHKIG